MIDRPCLFPVDSPHASENKRALTVRDVVSLATAWSIECSGCCVICPLTRKGAVVAEPLDVAFLDPHGTGDLLPDGEELGPGVFLLAMPGLKRNVAELLSECAT